MIRIPQQILIREPPCVRSEIDTDVRRTYVVSQRSSRIPTPRPF